MPKWTDSQQNSIDVQNGTVLVSAAAGSGKTAVLVERVIKMITDENTPIDVDRLLIVTFTNAAAAEMKSRISSSLQKIIKSNPRNMNAQKQLSLLSNANICTIDAFCLNLVKENYFDLGIPCEFSVMDESENDIICENAINEVLDLYYTQGDADFVHLVEAFTLPDNDKDLITIIKELLRFIYAEPFPYIWLNNAIELYNPSVAFDKTVWSNYLKDSIKELLNNAKELVSKSTNEYEGFELESGDEKIFDCIKSDKALIDSLIIAIDNSIDNFYHKKEYSFSRFPSVRKNFNEDLKPIVQSNRKMYKSIVDDAVSLCFSNSDEYCEDVAILYPIYKMLFKLIKDIDIKMKEVKIDNASFSFSDIEHFAINLLFNIDKSNKINKTSLANDLTNNFYQILVDEYQDTNEAQDMLFSYLSNGNNMFMVGDVKQSIYRFRLAMPEIFTKKKNDFFEYDKNNKKFPAKIILDKNFRSRKGICSYVNHIFSYIMSQGIGGIDYNEEEYLNYGAEYKEDDYPNAEVKILTSVNSKNADEKEALAISKTIKEIISSKRQIKDKDRITKQDIYRNVNYGDIVILMRSLKSHIDTYREVLTNEGIPLLCDNASNLFENSEIILLTSLLRVINNPMNDISLLCVLKSPIYSFTDDELSKIRIENNRGQFYHSILSSNNDKVKKFIDDLTRLRKLSVTMPVAEFIRHIVMEKSLIPIVYAMGNAQEREQNIIKLEDIASNFDKGNSVGLTSFIRYLDSVINSQNSINSATISPSGSKTVKIMSIHHSKGLEFPICILAGATHRYNTADSRKKLLIDSKFGIASKCHNEEDYYQYPSIPYACVKSKINSDMMGENLRVLYVAMTRAKESFITFVTTDNPTGRLKKLSDNLVYGKPLPYACKKITCDADFILMAALTHKNGCELRELVGAKISLSNFDYNLNVSFVDDLENDNEMEDFIQYDCDDKLLNQIDEKLKYSYSYSDLSSISAKRSASELDDSEESLEFLTSSKPSFMTKDKMSPSDKGTAMHAFMEHCDYKSSYNDLENEITRLANENLITKKQADSLNRASLKGLLGGEFAKRMFNSTNLYREFKVSSFIKATEIEDTQFDDKIFVQGIADCVFEENDELVLVDYKTDKIKDENELIKRYEKQLAFYKISVEKTLLKPVKEMYLYSFSLSKLILVKKI